MSSFASPLFADRIVNMAVTGSLVRIEFGALSAPKAEGQKPSLEATQVLVMPLEGFIASLGLLDGLVKRLVKDGLLKPPASTNTSSSPQ